MLRSFSFPLPSGTKPNPLLHSFMWQPLVKKVENAGMKQMYPSSMYFF